MKNLANCAPSEFLKQTVRIKRSLEKWVTDIDLKRIRSQMPELADVPSGASKEEKQRITEENKRKIKEQGTKNLSQIMDAAFEQYPDETLEVLALFCFVEPKDVDDYPISDYLTALSEMVNDDAVIGFFTSLSRLGQSGILNA